MTAPTTFLWALAGSPELSDKATKAMQSTPATVCCVCACPAETSGDVNRLLGSNFSDRTLFRDPTSTRVCPACTWCMSGKPPATLRMWSVVAVPGEQLGPSHPKAWLQDTPGLLLTNRANTAPIIDTLLAPPAGEWLVTVAVSSQKHVAPYGTVNVGTGPWVVRMEDVTVASGPDEWGHVYGHALALRRPGVPADDVRAGRPRYLKTRDQLDTWKRHADQLDRYTRSPLLDLALWCVTKPIIDNPERTTPT